MGMFDTLIIHDNFNPPDPRHHPHETIKRTTDWQTKSLECNMFQYEITSNGRLLLLNAPFSDEGVSIDQEMHGEITFYDSVGEICTPSEMWLEYTATFVRGFLVDITSNCQSHAQLMKNRADMGVPHVVDKFCPTCDQAWADHNDDGSCVQSDLDYVAEKTKEGYCKECRVKHHDTCSMTTGCPCCENTMENL